MREINDTLWLGKLPKTWNTVELGQVYEERKVKVKETIYEPLSVTMKGIVPQLVYCLIDIYHNNMVFYAVFWYTKRNGGEFIWQERKSIMLSSPIRNIKS